MARGPDHYPASPGPQPPGWWRTQLTLPNLVVVATLVFWSGAGYRQLDDLNKRVAALETDLKTTYVRKDVQEADSRAVLQRIAQLDTKVDEVRALLLARSRSTATPKPPDRDDPWWQFWADDDVKKKPSAKGAK